MPIDTSNNFSGINTASQATGASRFGELSSDQFTRIMLSELQSQDPLKPNDSNALLQQLSAIRSIESNLSLEKNLKTIVSQNQLSSAAGLLGAQVGGLTDSNNRVAGTVVAVGAGSGGVSVRLSTGWVIPFSQIDSIQLPGLNNPNPTPPPTPTPPPIPTPPPTPTTPVNPGTPVPTATTAVAATRPGTAVPIASLGLTGASVTPVRSSAAPAGPD